MQWWEAILLGIVQGLTEFLPVSSSGHLMILKEYLGIASEGFLDFTITVHFATVLSTIIIFRKEIINLLKGLLEFKYNHQTEYILKILLSAIPIAIVGLFFKDYLEEIFSRNLTIVAVCLLVTAALLITSDFYDIIYDKIKIKFNIKQAVGLNYWKALLIGIVQIIAVLPGLSRSGATISSGILLGVKREEVSRFSFLMVLVPIIGEQSLQIFKKIVEYFSLSDNKLSLESVPISTYIVSSGSLGLLQLFLGFIFAFLTGLAACNGMLFLVRKAKLRYFAVYCILMAIIILSLSI